MPVSETSRGARLLEPAQDALGLLGRGGRRRARGPGVTTSAVATRARRRPAGPRPGRRPRWPRAGRAGRRRSPSRRRRAGRAADELGAPVSAESRCIRAAARTKAASRSRCTAASSNRSTSASRAHLAAQRGDDAGGRRRASPRGRRRRARRRPRRVSLPSHGAPHRPISASAQAGDGAARGEPAPCTGAAGTPRAAPPWRARPGGRRRTGRGRWRRRRATSRTRDSRGKASTVSLSHRARSGKRERRL